MKIAFVHQNMPGQFKHLAAHFARDERNSVVFVTKRGDRALPGVQRVVYKTSREATPGIHHYLRSTENAVLFGQAVARALLELGKAGFTPDVVVGHPGWGETLFVKDVLPDTPYLNYCEFYYRSVNSDLDFAGPPELDAKLRSRMRNTPLLQSLLACDQGIAPTRWQKSVHPEILQPKISVVHDGIDTTHLRPDADATFTLPDGRVLTRRDPVVTYVARNLEPYRGFDVFMRAVPEICAADPDAVVLIVGGDEVSYGSPPPGGRTWREVMLEAVPVDPRRVVFLGRLDYPRFIDFLRVSRVHVYLTYPFVLSWSLLEAMALECSVVVSDTAPVREVVQDGENGLLFDFRESRQLADRVVTLLKDPAGRAALGRRARETVRAGYDLPDCLARQVELIRGLAG